MRRSILILLMVAGVVAGEETRDEHRLAALVPPDTMVLLELDDLGGYDWWSRETSLGRIWAEPQMQQFVGGMTKAVASAVENLRRQGMDPFAMAGLEPKDFTGITIQRAGLAIIDIDAAQQGRPDFVLTLQCRDGIKKVEKIVTAARTMAGAFAGIGFPTEKHGDIDVAWAKVPYAGEIAMAFVGNRMIVTSGRARMHDVLARLKGGRAQALAGAPQFVETLRRMGAGKSAMFGYIDVPRMSNRVSALISANVGGSWRQEAEQIVTAFGFDAIEHIAIADVPQGTNWRSEFFVKLKERRGLFSFIQDAPTSHRFAAYTPSNPLLYSAERADMGRYLDEFVAALDHFEPGAKQEMAEILARYNKVLGIDVRKDLVGSLGHEWAGYVDVPEGGGLIPDVVLFASVKDRARLSKSLRALVEKYSDVLAMHGERKARRAPRIRHRKSKAGAHTIHSIEITQHNGEPVPVMPSWTLGDDYIILALWPHTLRNALSRPHSLRDNPEFNKLRQSVPQGATASSYVDCAALVGFAYNTLVPALQAVQGAANRELQPYGASLNFHELPPSSVITKHLSPCMSYFKMEKDAVRMGYVSPFGLSVATAGTAGLGALVGLSVVLVDKGREVEIADAVAEEEVRRDFDAERRAAMERMRRGYEERLTQLERQIEELKKFLEEK